MPNGRLVLGVDPGVASTGVGVVRERDGEYLPVAFDCVRTKAGTPFPQRLETLHDACAAWLKRHRPDMLAMERLFFTKNAKTAISVGQAQGAIILAAARARVAVVEYTPMEVKQSVTGDGRADKRAVALMVQKLLRLDEPPTPDDTADALAVAYCHLVSTRNRPPR